RRWPSVRLLMGGRDSDDSLVLSALCRPRARIVAAGYATPEFARKAFAGRARAFGPTVARLAGDFQEHRTAARELAGQAAEVERLQDGYRVQRSRRSAWRTWRRPGDRRGRPRYYRPLARRRGRCHC